MKRYFGDGPDLLARLSVAGMLGWMALGAFGSEERSAPAGQPTAPGPWLRTLGSVAHHEPSVNGLQVVGNLAYVIAGGYSNLVILDVTTADQVVELGRLSLYRPPRSLPDMGERYGSGTINLGDFQVVDGRIYISRRASYQDRTRFYEIYSSLEVVDGRDPANLRRQSLFTSPTSNYGGWAFDGMTVVDRWVYVVGMEVPGVAISVPRLFVFDRNDPDDLRLVARTTPGTAPGIGTWSLQQYRAGDLFASTNALFTMGVGSPPGENQGSRFRLLMLDRTEPLDPVIVSTESGVPPNEWSSPQLEFEGELVYAALGPRGLRVYRTLTDPVRLEPLATYVPGGSVEQVRASGDYAFVLDPPAGISVLDVADPTQPRLVASYACSATSLDVVEHRVFAMSSTNLLVLELTSAAQRPELTTHPQDQTVQVHTNVTLAVTATGTPPLRYRWQTNAPWGAWVDLAGAIHSALVFTNVRPANLGQYQAVVANDYGTATSHWATLTVWAAGFVPATTEVSTWAGSGEAGAADGPRGTAQFDGPDGGFVDGVGNVYVADRNNHRIRRISPDGVVSTLAGSGAPGFADGPAAQAQFSDPLGVCVDSAGNVYVADAGNHRIRRIEPTGAVSTVAGTGESGYRDGPGTSALLDFPNDLVIDPSGTLWITELKNHTVRRIASDGSVSTWVGNGTSGFLDGPRLDARLNQPGGIARDNAGNLYVTEQGGQRVRKVSSAGLVRTLAGDGTSGYVDGEGAKARFRHPEGIVVGALGYVYVADRGNHAIRRISPATSYVETLAGTGEGGSLDGNGMEAQFADPTGIGVTLNGMLYVTDGSNQRVRRLSPPDLHVYRLGNGLVVNWLGSGRVLQTSTNLGATTGWQELQGRTNGPVGVPTDGPEPRFYRLREVSVAGSFEPDPARWAWIPAGQFTMGSPPSEPNRRANEGPQTAVRISRGYWLGRYEVTQREYLAVMGTNPSAFKGDPEQPVERVSWEEASRYCRQLTSLERAAGRLSSEYEHRLPTEAEWEYACRAGTTTATAFGQSLSSSQANLPGNLPYNGGVIGPTLGRTAVVGSYAPNAWGLYDMHGNVQEWCLDGYRDSHPGGTVVDPRGPSSAPLHVSRGGSFEFGGQFCRSASRDEWPPSSIGFRVALVAMP